jgi:Lysozyme like domain
MKKLFVLILCVTTLIYLIPTSPKVTIEEQPVAVVQALAEPIVPEVVPEPIPTIEPIVEPPSEPTPEPVYVAPEPVQMSGDCSLVNNYTDWDTRVAYAICMAESTGNVMAHNSGDNHGSCVGSYSLMQVGCFWYPFYGYSSADYYNPQVNMEIAHNIWQRQGGFGAWTTYTGGKYTKHL